MAATKPAASKPSVTIQKKALVKALSMVLPATARSGLVPFLSHVLLEGEKDSLWLTGADGNMSISTSVEASCVPFKCGAPAHKLYGLVKLLPEGDVVMKVANGRMIVESGTSSHKMPVLEHKDFPPQPEMTEVAMTVRGTILNKMIQAVKFAADRQFEGNKVSPLLGGIAIQTNGTRLQVVACDGSQLAGASTKLAAPEYGVVVPLRGAEVLSGFAALTADTELTLQDNNICLQSEAGMAFSNLFAGKYPNWQAVIPPKSEHTATMDGGELLLAMKRAAFSASVETDTSVNKAMKFVLTKDRLTLETKDIEHATDGSESLPISCPSLKTAEMAIGVNGSQVLDFLGVVGTEEIKLSFGPAGVGLKFEPTKSIGFDFVFVSMPVNLRW